jgi:hypothetical protein
MVRANIGPRIPPNSALKPTPIDGSTASMVRNSHASAHEVFTMKGFGGSRLRCDGGDITSYMKQYLADTTCALHQCASTIRSNFKAASAA